MSDDHDEAKDSPAVAASFLARFLADREAGSARTLADYQALFPGFADLIAREHAELGAETADGSRRPASPEHRIGRFRILGELGRGGQSIVYLAEDAKMGRRVALKVLPASFIPSEKARERFLREAEVAGRLDHPGICVIYEVGEHEGLPFIAMRLIEGETLAAHIATARSRSSEIDELSYLELPDEGEDAAADKVSWEANSAPGPAPEGPSERHEIVRIVRLIERTARALHVAHEDGLLHRDVKPGNIIVTPEGQPVLVDFGLARDEKNDGHSLTMSGDLMGTPAYMSPEQLLAQRIRIDRRSDVYSIGVTLFECLTLTRPFDAPTREALYQRILSGRLPDIRKLNSRVSRDLAVVVTTALERDRERRYPSALAFAEDLRRVVEFEPIRARPAGPILRFRRWTQRSPALATATLVSFVALFAGLLLVLHFLRESRGQAENLARSLERERNARQAAAVSADSARAARDREARSRRRAEGLRLGALALVQIPIDAKGAASLALEAVALAPEASSREVLCRALEQCSPAVELAPEQKFLPFAAFSKDGRTLVTVDSRGLKVWSLSERRLLRSLPIPGVSLTEVTVDLSGRLAALLEDPQDFAGRPAGGIIVVDLVAGRILQRVAAPGRPFVKAIFSADAGIIHAVTRLFVEGVVRGSYEQIVVATGERRELMTVEDRMLQDLVLSPDQMRIALIAHSRAPLLVDTLSGAEIMPLGPDDRTYRPHVAFSADSKRLLVAGPGFVRRVDLETKEVSDLEAFFGQDKQLNGCLFTVDAAGDLAVSTPMLRRGLHGFMGQAGPAAIWSLADGRKVADLGDASSWATVSADGSRVVACTEQRQLSVFDPRGRRLAVLPGPESPIQFLALGVDGSHSATIHLDGTLWIWDLGKRGLIPRDGMDVRDVVIDGDKAIVLRENSGVEILDARSLELLGAWPVACDESGFVKSTDFVHLDRDPGSGRLVLLPDLQSLVVIDGQGAEVTRFQRDELIDLTECRLLAGGRSVLMSFQDRRTVLVEVATGREIAAYTGVWRTQTAFDDARNFVVLATPYEDSGGYVVDGASGETLWSITDGSVGRSAVDPEGKIVALAAVAGGDEPGHESSYSSVIRLRDAGTGQLLRQLEGHGDAITDLSFSRDGRHLISASRDGSCRLWDLATGTVEAVLGGHDGQLLHARISPAGDRVLGLAVDGYLRVWDLASRTDIMRMRLSERVSDERIRPFDIAEFVADGDAVLTCTNEGALRIIPVNPEAVATDLGIERLDPQDRRRLGLED